MRLDTLLSRGVVCFDGGFGSQLTARAVPFACAEALNLTRPDAVRAIHHDYVRAGAQVVETNTLGANPIRLRAHGLAEDAARIVGAAVEHARQAGAPCVACSMGTTAEFLAPVGTLSFEEATACFAAPARAAAEAGADFLLTETLTDLAEARAMWAAAREAAQPTAEPKAPQAAAREAEAALLREARRRASPKAGREAHRRAAAPAGHRERPPARPSGAKWGEAYMPWERRAPENEA